MEYINFSKITEKDFDDIILNAGGKRYTDDPTIQVKNCDYILDDSVIELKIIEEEPIEKRTKQEKLAKLFSITSVAKTIVLDPNEDLEYEYYKILSTPIENQLKKASKQLNYSAKEVNANTKIAIIMNNGLTMTSHEEFKKLATERAKNNTSGIDILIVCGIYYFSDKFDMRVMIYFDDIQIQENSNDSIIERIKDSWHVKIEEYMTHQITDMNINRSKEPIQDLFFEYEGIRYVKPPIQWGIESEFYGINGRPREDTTNKHEILPLVTIIPIFSYESYEYFKNNIIQKNTIQNTLEEYIKPIKEKAKKLRDKIQTLVPISISINELKTLKIPFSIYDIQKIADEKYENFLDEIKNESIQYSGEFLNKNFIFVEVQEIGIDKANDIAFISTINYDEETRDFTQKWLVYGERISYEYGFILASSYCISLGSEKVYYYRNEDYKWK
jgi:hypothetical protein